MCLTDRIASELHKTELSSRLLNSRQMGQQCKSMSMSSLVLVANRGLQTPYDSASDGPTCTRITLQRLLAHSLRSTSQRIHTYWIRVTCKPTTKSSKTNPPTVSTLGPMDGWLNNFFNARLVTPGTRNLLPANGYFHWEYVSTHFSYL